MNIIICEMNRQSRFDARDRVLRAGALGLPRGMGWGRCGRGVQDGGHMYPNVHHSTVYNSQDMEAT